MHHFYNEWWFWLLCPIWLPFAFAGAMVLLGVVLIIIVAFLEIIGDILGGNK